MLRDVVGWGGAWTREVASLPLQEPATVRSPDWSVVTTASGALVHEVAVGALVLVVDPVDSLRDAGEDGWAASPIDRAEELLRHAGVEIGVVTDGRWWAVVSASRDGLASSGVVDAQTWIAEPATRNAFLELLGLRTLVGGRQEDRLPAVFADSVAAAEDVTNALGVQVRQAVELLVQAMSEAAVDARRSGLPDPLPVRRHEVYDAAVTVMMRVVFLLFAEERGLFPQGRLFAQGYGVTGELTALDQRARDEGSEALDTTYLTWHRLLATSRALFEGASFEDLRLPSYGGSLFDPARFGFLSATTPRSTLAVAVSDRVMLEVLRAVQMASVRGEPARRISFRDVDVEQIGYIYEGLLGYTCVDVDEVTVGLLGKTGQEPEMALATLEGLAVEHTEPRALADAVRARSKADQPASEPASASALAKALTADAEDADRALRAVSTDANLRERLLPFVGVVRRDLRDRPLVLQRGGLAVVETPSRATAGAHYTPRSLAEEVVQHALEPLVFSPGPHQTSDHDAWVPVSSDAVLDLKIADIACGSGAFLVAAARYLSGRLVEAWRREGVARGPVHEQQVHATRQVVARCLYGADINAMAVEMCKLSLWLVSLDPRLPFSFVDDKVLCGNSLLGLTDRRQLERLHIDPDRASRQTSLLDLDVEGSLERAARLRRSLATEVDDADPQRSAATKRRQWREHQEATAQLTDVADAVVAVGLRQGGTPGRKLDDAYEALRHTVERAYPPDDRPADRSGLDEVQRGLEPTVPTDYARWRPLHWVLAVPDVLGDGGGFDAVIGNPPFLGGKRLRKAIGGNVRDWLVHIIAGGKRGSADEVAYFFLRAYSLLNAKGKLGLIATNTVAQGETREVGLDQLVAEGFEICRSKQSAPWPARGVTLEYAAVWGAVGPLADSVTRYCDETPSPAISTLLEPVGGTYGVPHALQENLGLAHIGCIVGLHFVVSSKDARLWISSDPDNERVVKEYLNGDDLNSSPRFEASRHVVDFTDIPVSEISTYRLPSAHVRAGTAVTEGSSWWRYHRSRPQLRKQIKSIDRVIVLTQTSATQIPAIVPVGPVFDQKLVVFGSDDPGLLAVLSSSVHRIWATCWGPTRTGDPVYTPSDIFATFPRPRSASILNGLGDRLDTERREIMLRRVLGLTKLYNLVNDPDLPDAADADVARMRAIHVEVDEAVMQAYGWDDVPLDHGFHTYRQMTRWTISPAARVEVLDRLLEENHRRAAAQDGPPPEIADDETDAP